MFGLNKDEKLLKAAEKGDYPAIPVLIDKGSDVNTKDRWGNTALILAAEKGHVVTVQILLNKGADINIKNR